MKTKDIILINEARRYLSDLVQQHGGSIMIVVAIPVDNGVSLVGSAEIDGDPEKLGFILAYTEKLDKDIKDHPIAKIIDSYSKY